jgi:hypothetical protein
MTDYPKLLVHKGKHGDTNILIASVADEGPAWLAMFRSIDKWTGYYEYMDKHEREMYEKAKEGEGWAAHYLLDGRSDCEYEEVYLESLHTPESLEAAL